MIVRLYSLYDKRTQLFSSPFAAVNDDTAVRMVYGLLNDRSTTVAQYPEDYDMWRLGMFDDASGLVSDRDTEKLGNIAFFKKREQENKED